MDAVGGKENAQSPGVNPRDLELPVEPPRPTERRTGMDRHAHLVGVEVVYRGGS